MRWGQRLGVRVLGLPEACHETRSRAPSLWSSFPQYNTVLEILAGLSSPGREDKCQRIHCVNKNN